MMNKMLRKLIGWLDEMRFNLKHKIKKALLDLKRFTSKVPTASIVFVLALVFTMAFSSYVIFASDTEFNKYYKTAGTYDPNTKAFLEFGTYPQRKLTEGEVTTLLANLGSVSLEPGTVYTDPTNGEKYLYEEGYTTGVYNWYEVKPIKWEVLDIYEDKNQIVLMTESVIDAISYDTQDSSAVTWSGSSNYYPAIRLFLNSYDTTNSSYGWKQSRVDSKSNLTYNDSKFSSFRERGFLAKAFTDEEREIIVEDSNKVYDSSKDGSNVKDKVRLLSRIETYGSDGVANGFVENDKSQAPTAGPYKGINTNRIGFATDYSAYWYSYNTNQQPSVSYDGYDTVNRPSLNWWTKSRSTSSAYTVSADGSANGDPGVYSYNGVRPVITLNINDIVSLDETRDGSLASPYKIKVKEPDPNALINKVKPYFEDDNKGFINYGSFPQSLATEAEASELNTNYSSPVDGQVYEITEGANKGRYLYEKDYFGSKLGHWYKFEPIKWQILSVDKTNNSITVMTESCIDSRAVDTQMKQTKLLWDGTSDGTNFTSTKDGKHAYPSLRLYLNSYDTTVPKYDYFYTKSANEEFSYSSLTYTEKDESTTPFAEIGFMQKAFTDSEREFIIPSTSKYADVSTDGNKENYKDSSGNYDKIRLLGYYELLDSSSPDNSNCGSSYGFGSNASIKTNRIGFATDYSLARNVKIQNGNITQNSKDNTYSGYDASSERYGRYSIPWQTKSISGTYGSGYFVYQDGSITTFNFDCHRGIRPVMKLSLNDLQLDGGEGSWDEPYGFKEKPIDPEVTIDDFGTYFENPSHGYVYFGSFPKNLATTGEQTELNSTIVSPAEGKTYEITEGANKGKYLLQNSKWFKFEPIKWQILKVDDSNNKIILLSESCLESRTWDTKTPPAFWVGGTNGSGENVAKLNYPSLRLYLNSYDSTQNKYTYSSNIESYSYLKYTEHPDREFYEQGFLEKAFSDVERDVILREDNIYLNKNWDLNYEISDKVRLLTWDEMYSGNGTSFGFASESNANGISSNRIGFTTDYSKEKLSSGAISSSYDGYNGRDSQAWYLRSYYSTNKMPFAISTIGSLDYNASYEYRGIRPVISLDISRLTKSSGKGSLDNPYALVAEPEEPISKIDDKTFTKWFETGDDHKNHGFVYFGRYANSIITSAEVAVLNLPQSPTDGMVYTSTVDGNEYLYESSKWVKIEPIKWQIINIKKDANGKDELVLLSESGLQGCYYDNQQTTAILWDGTGGSEGTDANAGKHSYPALRLYLNSYDCSQADYTMISTPGLRTQVFSSLTYTDRYLTDNTVKYKDRGFLAKAFSDNERAAIVPDIPTYYNLEQDGNVQNYKDSSGKYDKVRLLTYQEMVGSHASDYGFNTETDTILPMNPYMTISHNSSYNPVNDLSNVRRKSVNYWLSSYSSGTYFYYVSGYGGINSTGQAYFGIRPVITLSVPSVSIESGNGSVYNPYMLSAGPSEIYTEELTNDGEIKYYLDGYMDEEGVLHNAPGDVTVLTDTDFEGVNVYSYSNKMALLEGESDFGAFSEWEDYYNLENKRAAITNNGLKLTNASELFDETLKTVKTLEKVDLTNFDSSNLTDTFDMFRGCAKLESITFPSDFNTSKVGDFKYMFNGCESLEELDLSTFEIKNGANVAAMFGGCASLEMIQLPKSVDTVSEPELPGSYWAVYKEDGTKLADVSHLPGKNTYALGSYVKSTAPKVIYQDPDDESIKYYDTDAIYSWDISDNEHPGGVMAYLTYATNTSTGEKEEDASLIIVTKTSGAKIRNFTHAGDWYYNVYTKAYDVRHIDIEGNRPKFSDGGADNFSNCLNAIKGGALTDSGNSDKVFTPWSIINLNANNSNLEEEKIKKLIISNPTQISDGALLFACLDNLEYVDIANLSDSSLNDEGSFDKMFYNFKFDGTVTLPNGFGQNCKDFGSMFMSSKIGELVLPSGFGKNAETMWSMFNCFDSEELVLPTNFGKVVSETTHMFKESTLNKLTINDEMGSEIKVARWMFYNMPNIKELIIPDGFGSKTFDMELIFASNPKLENIVLPDGFGDLAYDLAAIFGGCEKLKTINDPDLTDDEDWVILPEGMGLSASEIEDNNDNEDYYGCDGTDIQNIFSSCQSLHKVDLSKCDFDAICNVSCAFEFDYDNNHGNSKLDEIIFPETFNLLEDAYASRAFAEQGTIKTLNLHGFNITEYASCDEMLLNCNSLEKILLPEHIDDGVEIELPRTEGWYKGYKNGSLVGGQYTLLQDSDDGTIDELRYAETTIYINKGTEDEKSFNILEATYAWDISQTGNGGVMAYYFETGNINSDGEKEGELVFYSYSDDYTVSFGGNYFGYEFGKMVCSHEDEALKTDDLDVDDPLYYKTVLNNNRGYYRLNGGENTYQPWQLLETFDDEHTITKVIFTNEIKLPLDSEAYFALLPNVTEFVNMENLNTEEVYAFIHMFWGLTKLEALDLSYFDAIGEVKLDGMFEGCVKLDNLNFSNFSDAIPESFWCMFANCTSLSSVDLSMFDTSSVSSMWGMFKNCINLESLDLSNWDTESCNEFDNMFLNCDSLTELDISHFNFETAGVSFSGMFASTPTLLDFVKIAYGDYVYLDDLDDIDDLDEKYSNEFSLLGSSKKSNLKSINLGETEMNSCPKYLFYGLESLEEIDLSNLSFSSCSSEDDVEGMFGKCSSLKKIILPDNIPTEDGVNVTLPEPPEDLTWRGNDNSGPYVNLPKKEGNLEYIYLKSSIIEVGEGENKKQYRPSEATFAFDLSEDGHGGVMGYYFKPGDKYNGEFIITTLDPSKKMITFDTASSVSDSGTVYEVLSGYPKTFDINALFGNSNRAFATLEGGVVTPWSVINSYNKVIGDNSYAINRMIIHNDTKASSGKKLFAYLYGPSTIEGLDKLDTTEMIASNYMFMYSELQTLTFGEKGTFESITDASNTFYNAKNLTNIYGMENITFEAAQNLSQLFEYCSSLEEIDLSSFKTSNVTDMNYMFDYCKSLTSITFGDDFDTSSVKDFSGMFGDCTSLTSLNISMFNTSQATKLINMFHNCKNLESLDVSNFDTSNVRGMEYMFLNCASLESLDISNFDFTSAIFDCMYDNAMFATFNSKNDYARWWYLDDYDNLQESEKENCDENWERYKNDEPSKLVTLTMPESTLDSQYYNSMFLGLSSLQTLDMSHIKIDADDDISEMIYGLDSVTCIKLPANLDSSFDGDDNLKLPVKEGYAWIGYNDGNKVGGAYTHIVPQNSSLDELRLVKTSIVVNEGTADEKIYNTADALYEWDISENGDGGVLAYYFNGTGTISGNTYDGEVVIFAAIPGSKMMRFNSRFVNETGCSYNHDFYDTDNYSKDLNPATKNSLFNAISESRGFANWDLQRPEGVKDTFAPWTLLQCIDDSDETINKPVKYIYFANDVIVGDTCVMFADLPKLEKIDLSHLISTTSGDNQTTNMSFMFEEDANLTSIVFPQTFNTSKVTDISFAFYHCYKLEDIDIRYFDSTNIKDAKCMFKCCKLLTTINMGNNFTLSNCEDFSLIFESCESLEELDISKWNTSSAEDLTYMFYNCKKLSTLKTGENFKAVKGTIEWVEKLFAGCEKLEKVDLSGFDISLCNTEYEYSDIFKDMSSLKEIILPVAVSTSKEIPLPEIDGKMWRGYKENSKTNETYKVLPAKTESVDTIKLVDYTILAGDKEFKPSDALYTWDISKEGDGSILVYYFDGDKKKDGVTDTLREYDGELVIYSNSPTAEARVFTQWLSYTSKPDQFEPHLADAVWDCNATPWSVLQYFTNYDVNEFYIASSFKITSGHSFFGGLDKVTSLDASKIDMTENTSCEKMFDGCDNLQTVVLNNTTTDKLTNMVCMFNGDANLEKITFGSNFNTSNVTNMNCLFNGCESLTDVDIENIDTSSVTNISYMFSYTPFTELDLSHFNLQNIQKTSGMFEDCHNLQSITWPSTPVQMNNLTYMFEMFQNCYSLKEVDLSYFSLSKPTDFERLFQNCYSLEEVDLTNIDTSLVTNVSYMFLNCVSLEEIDLTDNDFSSVIYSNSFFAAVNNIEEFAKWNDKLDWYLNATNEEKETYEEDYDWCRAPHESNLEHIYFNESQTFNPNSYNDTFFGLHNLKELDLSSFVFTSDKTFNDNALYHLNSLKKIILPTKTLDLTSVVNLPEVEDSYWTGYKDGAKVGGKYETLPFNENGNGEVDEVRLISSVITVGEGANKKEYRPSDAKYIWDISDNDHLGSIMAYYFDGTTNKDGNPISNPSKPFDGELVIVNSDDNAKMIEFTSTIYKNALDGEVYLEGNGNAFNHPQAESIESERGYYYNDKYYTPWSILEAYNKDGHKIKSISFANDVKAPSGWLLFAHLPNLEEVKGIEKLSFDDNASLCLMFANDKSLREIDLSGLDISKVTTVQDIFAECELLKSVKLPTSANENLEKVYEMFFDCFNLESVNSETPGVCDLSNFDMHNAYGFDKMFINCWKIKKIDFGNNSFENAKSMNQMFLGCHELTDVKFATTIDTSKLEEISYMFADCPKLTKIDLSMFDASSLKEANYVFSPMSFEVFLPTYGRSQTWPEIETMLETMPQLASNLQMLRDSYEDFLPNLNTTCESNLTEVKFGPKFVNNPSTDPDWPDEFFGMFFGCDKLTKLDLSTFNFTDNTFTNDIIEGCTRLTEIKVPNSMTNAQDIPLVSGDHSYWIGCNDSNTSCGKKTKLEPKSSTLTKVVLVTDTTSPVVTKVASDKSTFGQNKDITLTLSISEVLDTENFASINKDNFYIKIKFGNNESVVKYDNYGLDPATGDFILIFKGKTPTISEEGEFKLTGMTLVNNGEEIVDLASNELDTSSLKESVWKNALSNVSVNTTGFPISITAKDYQEAQIVSGGTTNGDLVVFTVDFSDITLVSPSNLDDVLSKFELKITNGISSKTSKNKTLTLKEVKDGSYPFASFEEFGTNKYKVAVNLSDDGNGSCFIEKDDTSGYLVSLEIEKGVLENADTKNIKSAFDAKVIKHMEEGSLTVKLVREGEDDKELVFNKQRQRFEDGNGNEVKFQDGDKIKITSPEGSKIVYKQDGSDFETPSNELVIDIDKNNPPKPYEEIGSYKDGYSINPNDLVKITINFVKLIIIKEGPGGTVTPLGEFEIDADEKEIQITVDADYKASIYEGSTFIKSLTAAEDYLIKNLKKLVTDLTVKVKFVSTKAPEPAPSGGGGGGGGGVTYTILPDTNEVLHKSYIKGYEDKTFRPNSPVTREEVATIVARLDTEFNEDYNFTNYNTFPDVDKRWSKNYIGFCKMKDLIHGYEDGSFGPTRYMTRAELAVLVSNFLRVQNADFSKVDLTKSAFSDVDGRWYEEAVNKLASLGILNGYEDGTFRGDNPVTRIEVTIVMNKINHRTVFDEIPEEYITKVTSMFKDVTPNRWFFNDVAEAAVDHPDYLY